MILPEAGATGVRTVATGVRAACADGAGAGADSAGFWIAGSTRTGGANTAAGASCASTGGGAISGAGGFSTDASGEADATGALNLGRGLARSTGTETTSSAGFSGLRADEEGGISRSRETPPPAG